MLAGLASMAVHPWCAAVLQDGSTAELPHVELRAVAGVNAARRLQDGDRCDLVVLAATSVDRLGGLGLLATGSARTVAVSPAAVAVARGAPHPRIDDETHLRQTFEAARTIGYSTGPSGDALTGLLQRWGRLADLRARLVQAAPGEPVAALVADGRAEVGVQQLSELLGQPGIDVVGPFPPGCEVLTRFVAAATVTGPDAASAQQAVDRVLDHLASPELSTLRTAFGLLAPGAKRP